MAFGGGRNGRNVDVDEGLEGLLQGAYGGWIEPVTGGEELRYRSGMSCGWGMRGGNVWWGDVF